jgi:ribosomal protein L7/L12
MKIKTVFFSKLLVFVLLFAFPICPAFSEEPQKDSTVIEKNKAEIIQSIEKFEEGLKITKGCISEAKTSTELERCRENIKTRELEEVQNKLSEMGESYQERKMKRFLPEK